jgi:hypothetical protein
MARIRSIKPEMRTSITVSQWPREVRYLFVLLWGYLDDYGRGVDDELLIASDCFPRDRDVTPERVDAWLELIADSGPLCRYEVDGRQYLHAPNWREHQKPSHPTRSKIPPCPDDEPEDFKRWREANPQRLRNRSRKAREGFESFPEGLPGASETPSGGAPRATSEASGRDVDTSDDWVADEAPWGDEPADQHGCDATPESLASSSGNSPGLSSLSKGAREQGSKGARERGVQGGTAVESARDASPATPARSDDRPAPIDIDGFELNDSMRRWAHDTFPKVDVDYETAQFLDHFRGTLTRRPNWYAEWQKWIRRANKWADERAARANVVRLKSKQRPGGARSALPTAEDIDNARDEDII